MLFRGVFILFIMGFFPDCSTTPDASMFYSSAPCIAPQLEHGRIRVKQRSRLLKFICAHKYELVGNRYATCINGRWDVPIPVCVRAGCSVPEVKNAVTVQNNNFAWIAYFCLPGFKLVGSPVIYCDGTKWNGTAPSCVDSTLPPSLSCDFEDPDICGWRQDELHDFDWKRLNKHTPSSLLFTGPSHDHTVGKGGEGYYMYIESTSRLENDTARILSPVYDNSYTKDGCFSFFYHMYGRTCGGLRVYQKPEYLDMNTMLLPENKDKYLLFEKWGEFGDYWFSSVSSLKNFSDSFQIVIEGVRGSSYTSDIAIDDVAILQGSNCTEAAAAAVTPSNETPPDSCVGRCSLTRDPLGGACHCSPACIGTQTCCPDFFDICLYAFESSTFLDDIIPASNPEQQAPQTQKYILHETSTTETTPTTSSTTTTTTTTTSTTTTTTTTPKPTTSTTTITPKPTTKITTPKLTPRPTTKLTTKPVTMTKRSPIPTVSTTKPTVRTTKPTAGATKPIPRTTKPSTKKPTPIITTAKTTAKITTVPTTINSHGVSRTFENHNVYHELVDKAKKEQQIEVRKITIQPNKDPKSSGKGWTILLVLVMVSLLAVVVVKGVSAGRSARGQAALARLWGRAARDQEVRYLANDDDL